MALIPRAFDDLVSIIKDLQRRVRKLETANPLQAGQVGTGGIQVANNGAISFLDSNGNKRLQLDGNGLHQYDPSGNLILLLGTLNASPAVYGLGVMPYGGTQLQQVGGTLSLSGLSATSVNTSYALVTFPAPSTITAVVGPSGSVMIGGSFEIDTTGAGVKGGVQVMIDGGSSVEVAAFTVAGAATATYVGGSTVQWSGLTPGTHTFTARYYTSGASASFNGSIYIQPL